MAYAALPAKGAGDTITVTNWDNIRDNFAAGVPDIYTTKGDLAAATGADAATRLAIGADDATLVPDSGEANGLAWQIQPTAHVFNSIDLDLAPAGWRTVTFDSETYDSDACHSTVANTGRLTVPAGGAGIYLIGACIEWDTSGGAGQNTIGLRFYKNGATVIGNDYEYRDVAGHDVSLLRQVVAPLVATDYVEVQVYHSANVDLLAQDYAPLFWFQWLRRTP